ncbi:MAG TPA: endonuclease/exonuclease/phosphatase family protein [Puia sp.]|nr:endonuclease/exonuclease/phosphatase family protein [Puia sp.]
MLPLRKFAKHLFLVLNFLVAILFLLSCCNAFLHPDKWWFISLLSFFFPLFLVLLLLFALIWLFISKRWMLFPLGCLLLGWANIHALFGLSLSGNDFSHKPDHSIRLMTWNVRAWDDFTTRKKGASGHRPKMLRLIDQQQADILCFQEFLEPTDSLQSNIRYIRDSLHFPYYFFSHDSRNYRGKYETGAIIFSRYPILHSERHSISVDNKSHESLIEADIDVNGKIMRVYTTHLQSVLFKPKDFRDVEIVRTGQDSLFPASKSLAKKLRYALSLRGYQADTVRKYLDKCPYPSVICGDFNDVPNSYAYFHIKNNRQDAFIMKNFGIGRTYVHISPTLRIDYILVSNEIGVLQSERMVTPYSDHHPVLADLQLSGRNR